MSTNTVDIIIPCYNTGRYLRQAIDSTLAQTYPHINVLVVDDGSTDNTREIVESYRGRVGYFYQENKGLPAARNAGIRQTAGEYVCVLDADDVILPSKVADQLAFLQANPSVGLLHSKVLAFEGDDIFHPIAEPWRPHIAWKDYLYPLSVICAICPSSVMIQREVFDDNLFPEDMTMGCEDWLFWARCALRGVVMDYFPKVHVLYRYHAGSMSGDTLAIANRESELMRRLEALFRSNRITDPRRLTVLSWGIKSIAARWLPLGNRERFQELLALSKGVLTLSGQDMPIQEPFPCTFETPPSLISLALSKEFFDLELQELAIVMFIKCGDIRILRDECYRLGQYELFADVVNSLAAAVSADSFREVYERYPIQNAGSVVSEGAELYIELERTIPHHLSLHGYVKHQLGLLAESRGEIERAERDIRNSISLNPNFSYPHFDLGCVLQSKGDFAGAERELRFSLELGPDFSFAHYELARCLEAQGDLAGAEAELNRSIELKSDFSFAYYYLGRLLEARGDYASAENELRRSIELNPDFSFAHYDLGRLLEARGDYEGAEEALRASIELNPDFSWAHYHLGRLLEAGRDWVGAEEEFLRCLALDSDFALCRLDYAKVLAKTGRYGKAAAEFLKASRTDPRASSIYLMGWLKSLLGKPPGHDRSKLKDSR